MVSFRTNTARPAAPSAHRLDAVGEAGPMRAVAGVFRWPERLLWEGAPDAVIRRDFDTLAARIRTLQEKVQREAAALQAR